uniref:SLC3A2_N domain-containing protein n=1 Tax=Steinernema glaseri TaxID=37863 RepID=A0A1I8A8E3_9BILA
MQALEEQELDLEANPVPKGTERLPSYDEAMHCSVGQAQPCDFNFYEYPVPRNPPPPYPGSTRRQQEADDPGVGKSLQKLLCAILCSLFFVWIAVLGWIAVAHGLTPKENPMQE